MTVRKTVWRQNEAISKIPDMKQRHAVWVLVALFSASFFTGFHSYRTTENRVEADMKTFKVGLWARNLTNTNYNTFAVESKVGGSTARFAQRGNPFQMGVDVNIHF